MINRDAQDLLHADFAHAVVCGDVARRNLDGMEGVDIVTVGFPCQPFSGLGLGHGRHEPGGRGALVDYTIEAILRLKRSVFLLENVAAFVKSDGGAARRLLLDRLSAGGL